jgi:putative endonuclease
LPRPGSGQRAERRALRHYRLRGYRILAANVWIAGYELDLIVRRGRRVVFCEVKSKSGTAFGSPEEMVDREKQRRLSRAAEAWLARHPECRDLVISFDVIVVQGGALRRLSLGELL